MAMTDNKGEKEPRGDIKRCPVCRNMPVVLEKSEEAFCGTRDCLLYRKFYPLSEWNSREPTMGERLEWMEEKCTYVEVVFRKTGDKKYFCYAAKDANISNDIQCFADTPQEAVRKAWEEMSPDGPGEIPK